jgi:hypothetical protein
VPLTRMDPELPVEQTRESMNNAEAVHYQQVQYDLPLGHNSALPMRSPCRAEVKET